MAATSKPYHLLSYYPTLIFIITYICTVILISFTKANEKLGFSVELIHRDSPNSPFFDHSTTPLQKLSSALHHSMNRATHFFSSKPNKTLAHLHDDDPESEITYASAEHIMAYSVGTPSFQTYGVFDTGSDFIWLQCHPCYECYNQTIPLFDLYRHSSTYRNYNCHVSECESVEPSVHDTHCDVVWNCAFEMRYLGRSTAMGLIAHDTLTLASTTGCEVSFTKTLFGCAHKTVGNFVPESSGIVGLGRGRFSLISQMGSSVQRRFSYCLTSPYLSSSGSNSKLHFGQNAVVSGPGTVSTPLVSSGDYSNEHYYVILEGVSVEDTKIEFDGGGKTASSIVEGNAVIDSGSRMSLLPENLYYHVESEVAKRIKLNRSDNPHKPFKLCYESESIESVKAPIITVHFRGADVKLSPINSFLLVSQNVACFAFASFSEIDMGLIGNLAQINLLVGFDFQNNIVNFKPMDCTML
ncbi:aspartic proteinase CDR1-like [Prosopis cineraria]|uniref:aspartic proteinase CDR1-like n=1 Tax=Prosopis cineraria TaxID=364024 RepID=UPI002410773F|nr:aspartic proteinase CDR1-like [Prosopis cineraria]